jgi:hypothetical protein
MEAKRPARMVGSFTDEQVCDLYYQTYGPDA